VFKYIAEFNKYEGDEEETKPMKELEEKSPKPIEEFKDEIKSKSCPNKGLEREDPKPIEELKEEVYEAGSNFMDEYEQEQLLKDKIITQPKEINNRNN